MNKKSSTKVLLYESVWELLRQKPASKISVLDITENCGLSKRSFYNHFRDRQDVIFHAYKDKLASILRSVPPEKPMRKAWTEYFKFAMNNNNLFYNTLQYDGQNNLFEESLKDIREILTERILSRNNGKPLDKELEYALLFWTSGLMHTGKELYLTSEIDRFDYEEMADAVYNVIPEILMPYIE